MKLPLFAKRLLGAVIGSALAVTVYSAYEFAAPKLTAHFLQQSVVSSAPAAQVPGGVTIRPRRSAESLHGIAPEQEKAQTQVGEDARKILERLMPGGTSVSSSSSSSSTPSTPLTPSEPESSVMETSKAIEHQQSADNLSKSGIGEWLAIVVAFGGAVVLQRKRILKMFPLYPLG